MFETDEINLTVLPKLNPGDILCYNCNGSKVDSDTLGHYFCKVCHGTGKLDWIENIVGKEPKPPSVMDRVNVKRMVDYVRKIVYKELDKTFIWNDVAQNVEVLLNVIKNQKGICEFFVETDQQTNTMNIIIKPTKVLESVHINFEVI